MLTLLNPAASAALGVDTAKSYCRVDGDAEDSLFELLVQAASSAAEGETGRALITQTWSLTLSAWPASRQIHLMKPPVREVAAVRYYNTAGTLITLDPEDYLMLGNMSRASVLPAPGCSWPTDVADRPDAIVVEFEAGYGGDPTTVPAQIRCWMMVWLSTQYEFREAFVQGSIAQLPGGHLAGLLDPYRVSQYA